MYSPALWHQPCIWQEVIFSREFISKWNLKSFHDLMWSILTTSPDHLLWTLLPSSPPSSSGTIQQVRLQGENYICAASPTPNCDFCRRVASGVWAGLRAEHSMLIASRFLTSPHTGALCWNVSFSWPWESPFTSFTCLPHPHNRFFRSVSLWQML